MPPSKRLIESLVNDLVRAREDVTVALYRVLKDYSRDEAILILSKSKMADKALKAKYEKALKKLTKAQIAELKALEATVPLTESMLQGLAGIAEATFMDALMKDAAIVKKVLTYVILTGKPSYIATGLEEMGGLSRAQIKTIANTALNTYSRSVRAAMAAEAPTETLYVYEGPNDAKTRPICLDMLAAGPLTTAEIDSRYPGAFLDGGGYNCRHSWVPMAGTSQKKAQTNQERAQKHIENLKKKGKWEDPKTLRQQKGKK